MNWRIRQTSAKVRVVVEVEAELGNKNRQIKNKQIKSRKIKNRRIKNIKQTQNKKERGKRKN